MPDLKMADNDSIDMKKKLESIKSNLISQSVQIAANIHVNNSQIQQIRDTNTKLKEQQFIIAGQISLIDSLLKDLHAES